MRNVGVLFAGAILGSSAAAQVTIKEPAKMPELSQKQNYEELMKTAPTRMKWSDGKPVYVNQYDKTYKGDEVRFNDKQNFYFVAKTDAPLAPDTRGATIADLAEIEAGTFHCAPAALAMMFQYWSKVHGFTKLDQGMTPTNTYLHHLAVAVDCNGLAPKAPLGDKDPRKEQAFAGTRGWLLPDAVNAILKAADPKYSAKASVAKWDFDVYKAEIAANRPVYLTIRKENQALSHAVVGIGYLGDKLIVRDPWEDGKEQMIAKPLGGIPFAPKEDAGLRYNAYGDLAITVPDYSSLTYADMVTVDVVPEPATMVALGLGTLAFIRRKRGVS